MDAKEFLNRYHNEYKKLIRLRAEMDAVWSALQAVNNDGMPKQVGVSDRVGNVAAELADLRTVYEVQADTLGIVRNETMAVIDCVSDPIQSALLIRRYIALETWSKIAECLYVSEPYARGELHRAAVESVQNVLDERYYKQ